MRAKHVSDTATVGVKTASNHGPTHHAHTHFRTIGPKHDLPKNSHGGGSKHDLPPDSDVPPESYVAETCKVCLAEPSVCRFLPCGHRAACKRCAKEWLIRNSSCPICRAKVTGISCITDIDKLHEDVVNRIKHEIKQSMGADEKSAKFFALLFMYTATDETIGRRVNHLIHDIFLDKIKKKATDAMFYRVLTGGICSEIASMYTVAKSNPKEVAHLGRCADLHEACEQMKSDSPSSCTKESHDRAQHWYEGLVEAWNAAKTTGATSLQVVKEMYTNQASWNELMEALKAMTIGAIFVLIFFLLHMIQKQSDCTTQSTQPNQAHIPFGHWTGASHWCQKNCGDARGRLWTQTGQYGDGPTVDDNGRRFNPKNYVRPSYQREVDDWFPDEDGNYGTHWTTHNDERASWVQEGVRTERLPSDKELCEVDNANKVMLQELYQVMRWLVGSVGFAAAALRLSVCISKAHIAVRKAREAAEAHGAGLTNADYEEIITVQQLKAR